MKETDPRVTQAAPLNVDGVCRWAGVSRALLYNEMKRGRLPYRKVGRRTLFLEQDLNAWLQHRGDQTKEAK